MGSVDDVALKLRLQMEWIGRNSAKIHAVPCQARLRVKPWNFAPRNAENSKLHSPKFLVQLSSCGISERASGRYINHISTINLPSTPFCERATPGPRQWPACPQQIWDQIRSICAVEDSCWSIRKGARPVVVDVKSDFRVLEFKMFKGITCCQDLTPQKLLLQSEPEGVFRICRYHLSWGTAQDSANYSYAFLAVGLWFDMVWWCLILQLGPFLAHEVLRPCVFQEMVEAPVPLIHKIPAKIHQ